MSQQKSLFSFYPKGGGVAKSKSNAQQRDPLIGNHEQRRASPHPQGKIVTDVFPQSQTLSQQDVLQSIQQRFMSREKTVKSNGIQSVDSKQVRPSVTGNKRIRETEEKLACPVTALTQDTVLQKRRKLLEAIGADDGIGATGAWAEAKAKFEWMTPSNIRDTERRKPSHPSYDQRSLHIPNDVFQKFSASQKQYWTTKCKYMDTVLFFKVVKS